MDNVAYVITDGSHNGTLKVGGVAGQIVFQDQPIQKFQRRIFNAYDSTIVEFLAIEEALKIIQEKKNKGDKIDHVMLATDSLDLLCLIDPQQVRDKFPEAIPFIERSKRYHKLNEKLQHLSKTMNVSVSLTKVKAHVPDEQASTLEKIHNEVDLMAKEPKDRVVKAIKVDSLEKAKAFSVMIPRDLSEDALKRVKRASLSLIKQGYSPRVLLQAGAANPMKDVIREYEDMAGEGAANIVRRSMRVIQASERVEPNAIPISGLNRSRARHWIAKEGGIIDEWELNGFEGALMNDIIASTLGNSHSLKVIADPEHKGRLTAKASELLLHHGEEKLMPEHLNMMTRAVKVHGVERLIVNHPRLKNDEYDDVSTLSP